MQGLKISMAAVLLMGSTLSAAAQDGQFAGKTIEVVVPFGEGGATFV